MKVVRREPDKGYLDSVLWVPKEKVNVPGLKKALRFEYMTSNTWGFLELYKESEHHLLVPRHFMRDLSRVPYEVIDCRPFSYPSVRIRSKITLDAKRPDRTIQREAARALLDAQGGVLQLSCGSGKTVVALYVISQLGMPAIIHLDNMQLLNQWRDEILKHLDVEEDDIGIIGDSSFVWEKPIVLATYQTISRIALDMPEETRRHFGVAIWDEGHHVAAPTYCRGADLYYGRRYLLTATPTRDDGQHVIYDMHVGPVLYKNLEQELTPEIFFEWTGIEVPPGEIRRVTSQNGEVHYGLLAAYMGSRKDRLAHIIAFLRNLREQNRKVLVLSPSITELVNLFAMWMGREFLYSEIPKPTNEELGFDPDLLPSPLTNKEWEEIEEAMFCPPMHVSQKEIGIFSDRIDKGFLASALRSETGRRQTEYLQSLLDEDGDAGLMIRKVGHEERQTAIRKPITFAVNKYGKEGLDAPDLDTIVSCQPIPKQNAAQQFMGRVLRLRPGKRHPRVYVLVDNVPMMVGMSIKMMSTLRRWPVDEGGPFKYHRVGYPEGGSSYARPRTYPPRR